MPEIKRIAAKQTFSAHAVETTEGVESTKAYTEIDLNEYSDVGSQFESQNRQVLARGRRPLKGTQTSRSDAFGYNIDNTVRNVEKQMASFMYDVPSNVRSTRHFLDGHPKVTAVPTDYTLTDAVTITLANASGLTVAAGDIVAVLDGVNNRRAQVVSAKNAAAITVAPLVAGNSLLLNGAMVATNAREIRVVGLALGTGGTIQGFVDRVELKYGSLAPSGLRVGEWVFIGGAGKNVGSNQPFYGRISAINTTTGVITFDATTRPISTTSSAITAGTPLFFGMFFTDDEDQVTLTHMRSLSKDGNGKNQVEVVTGCFGSELAFNASEKSFVNMDFTYIAMNTRYDRLDDTQYNLKYSSLITASENTPINTATDVYRQRLVIDKVGSMNTAAIHGLVQEFNVTLNNSLTEATGMGKLGNDGTTAGDVMASGNITAFFVDLAALEAVRCNCTASADLICARKNEGFVVDLPALTLTSNGLTISNDNSVQIELDKTAHKSKYGHVVSYTSFAFLPDEAMPDATACDC